MSIVIENNEKSHYMYGFYLNDSTDFEEIDPSSLNPKFVWDFLRGYFETNSAELNCPMHSVCDMPIYRCAVKKAAYLEKICNFLNLPDVYSFNSSNGFGVFEVQGTNALDLLGKLYDNASKDLCNYYVRKNYFSWCRFCVSVFPGTNPDDTFSWCKTHQDAVAPSKERVSDSGYDLTIISEVKKFNAKTTLYTTGIKVKPAFGWYLDVVPRSSIIKTGYMLANNVGIIDRAYTGEIMIALIKVDESAPDLELPLRIAQMIPRRIAHVNFNQVDDIEKTTRNDGGFGSTG